MHQNAAYGNMEMPCLCGIDKLLNIDASFGEVLSVNESMLSLDGESVCIDPVLQP
jgi:hypothetical protein